MENSEHIIEECTERISAKRELRHTVENYSRVIDMIDAILQFEEPSPKLKESYSWRELVKKIF